MTKHNENLISAEVTVKNMKPVKIVNYVSCFQNVCKETDVFRL